MTAPNAVTIMPGDCLETLRGMIARGEQVDAIVTDPPYHLTSIVKRFGGKKAAPCKHGTDGAFARASRGFMGKEWDGGDIAFRTETWELAFQVLKPGGHLLAFSGSRTYHRMAVAIEDAGFEVRDQLMWLYGTGMPKSHNVGKGLRKSGRDEEEAEKHDGLGTALKPAHEPVMLARKPLEAKSVAANVLLHGVGAINIDACRVPAEKPTGWGGKPFGGNSWIAPGLAKEQAPRPVMGRWPANVLHDGSELIETAFPKGAGRFFYSAKASKADRRGSKHPTVKPVELMRWCVRLITPPGGTVLDMFSGSGSTGEAALLEGCNAILCEREAEYLADIERRISAVIDELDTEAVNAAALAAAALDSAALQPSLFE